MTKNKLLFHPNYDLPESETFDLPIGGQVTVVGLGMVYGEEFTVEMVFTPAVQPDLCSCPPGVVDMPTVAASSPLMINRRVVKLEASKPFAVIDAPQGMRFRLVREGSVDAEDSNAWVWAINTDTHCVSDSLRGLDNAI